MSAHRQSAATPLVLHVIPTPTGRGAQRSARILVDRLNGQGAANHRLLTLFDGAPDVDVDLTLVRSGHSRPAEGFSPTVAVRLRALVNRMDPAVIVAHGGDALKYVVPSVTASRRAVVYCNIGTFAGSKSPLRLAWWRWLMSRSQHTVAVGDETLDETLNQFRVPVQQATMIANGRDPRLFAPRTRSATDSEPVVLFVGALTDQKQPMRFLETVALLRSEGRGFRARMVGDGPLATDLALTAPSLGVELLGARADVHEILGRADILLFTSRPAGEGMPGVLIECGLSGVVAVATAVPGAATIVDHGRTGLLVDDSSSALAEAVAVLLDDSELRVAMGAAARRRCVAQFSLDGMTDRWQALLDPLVDDHRRTGRGRRPTAEARAASARVRWTRAWRGNSHS